MLHMHQLIRTVQCIIVKPIITGDSRDAYNDDENLEREKYNFEASRKRGIAMERAGRRTVETFRQSRRIPLRCARIFWSPLRSRSVAPGDVGWHFEVNLKRVGIWRRAFAEKKRPRYFTVVSFLGERVTFVREIAWRRVDIVFREDVVDCRCIKNRGNVPPVDNTKNRARETWSTGSSAYIFFTLLPSRYQIFASTHSLHRKIFCCSKSIRIAFK